MMGVVSGFLFEIAKDLLKDLIKGAVEKKYKTIVEEQVRQALAERLDALPANNRGIQIDAETFTILIREIYSIASASKGLEVSGSAIRIQSTSRIKIPETIKEMQLRRKVVSMKQELESVVQQEGDEDAITLSSVPLLPPPPDLIFSQDSRSSNDTGNNRLLPAPSDLIFSKDDTSSESNSTPSQKPANTIVDRYRKQLESIIREEEQE